MLSKLATALFLLTSAQISEPFHISLNVNLVILHATVRDAIGLVPPGLQAGDFEVWEDGVRQNIRFLHQEEVPVTVGLAIDHSGSMKHKLAEVAAASRTFVHFSNPEDRMFVVNFNEKVTLGLPAQTPLSGNADELERAIAGTRPEGMTALYDAIFLAREKLELTTREKRVLVVVSDGGDNASRHSLDEISRMGDRSDALLYTIGVFEASDREANPGVLRRLARATGGDAFFPRRITDVVTVCERIAKDIRSQYTLGYVSSNPARNGSFRKIRLTAQSTKYGKLAVRTRDGYVAEGSVK